MQRIPVDGFVLALAGAVALSLAAPGLGASGGLLHLHWVGRFGIVVIFLLYGLTLAPDRMRAGAVHWRLHLVVQGLCFVGFPLVILVAGAPFRTHLPDGLWLGFLFLAALPGTISTAVSMTSVARGNLPAAIFNATISGLIAVAATPLLVAAMAGMAGVNLPVGEVIAKVFALVVLPLAAGQLLRPWLGDWAARQRWFKLFERGIILAIVANAMSDATTAGLWSTLPAATLAAVAVSCIALFWLMFGVAGMLCRWLGFNRADRIATLLSVTQKSLATGAPLAPVLFGPGAALGFIITPIMIYHLAQLIMASLIAGHWSRQPDS